MANAQNLIESNSKLISATPPGHRQDRETSEELFHSLLADEAMLVLRRSSDRTFRVLGDPPAWASSVAPGVIHPGAEFLPAEYFAFLDHFLQDAEAAWASSITPAVTSSIWTESLPNGEQLAFTATARRLRDLEILLIRCLG